MKIRIYDDNDNEITTKITNIQRDSKKIQIIQPVVSKYLDRDCLNQLCNSIYDTLDNLGLKDFIVFPIFKQSEKIQVTKIEKE